MLIAFLMFVALLGGAAITYAVMDGPRRAAQAQLRDLDAKRQELEDYRYDLADRLRAVAQQEREAERVRDHLADAAAVHGQRVADLATRTAAFDAQIVKYNHLAAENALLKTELRNLILRLARHEYEHEDAARGRSGLAVHRDRMGTAYLEEVRATVRKGLTPAGYPAAKDRLRAAYDRARAAGVLVADADERQALAELHAHYEKAVRAAVEREEQARLREAMREEVRRAREAEDAVRRAEQERQAVAAALDRALADAAGQHAAEVDRLRAQLAEAEARAERAKSNAEKGIRAGHVYVISNVGSFGPNVFKLGMSRRTNPQDRVDELGAASVPFPFDVHMMIATEDAPKLEAALHRAFHHRRVNRVNFRKEFFRATIEEIAAAVRTHHGEVTYEADAQALEYLGSQAATDADLAEMEGAYFAARQAAGPEPEGEEE